MPLSWYPYSPDRFRNWGCMSLERPHSFLAAWLPWKRLVRAEELRVKRGASGPTFALHIWSLPSPPLSPDNSPD